MSEDHKRQRFCIKSCEEELKIRILGYVQLFKLLIGYFSALSVKGTTLQLSGDKMGKTKDYLNINLDGQEVFGFFLNNQSWPEINSIIVEEISLLRGW